MKKQTLKIFGILIFIISCKESESKKITKLEKENTRIIQIKKEREKLQPELTYFFETYFENDSLTSSLKSNLEKIILDLKLDISKKPIKNKHEDNLIDTIITRIYNNTRITSYKTKNKELICKAKIGDIDFELNEFIKIGAKEDIIEKSLVREINNDTLKIGNLEQSSVFNLIFKSGILRSIEYDGYVD